MTMTISDLDAGTLYDLALFGADYFLERGTTFTIDDESLMTSGDFTDLLGGFSEGDTHVLFQGIEADVDGEIFVTITGGAEGFAAFNGLQIAPSFVPEPVPEPSTFVLGALALLGMVCFHLRRRR